MMTDERRVAASLESKWKSGAGVKRAGAWVRRPGPKGKARLGNGEYQGLFFYDRSTL